jgi:hypothetical protein
MVKLPQHAARKKASPWTVGYVGSQHRQSITRLRAVASIIGGVPGRSVLVRPRYKWICVGHDSIVRSVTSAVTIIFLCPVPHFSSSNLVDTDFSVILFTSHHVKTKFSIYVAKHRASQFHLWIQELLRPCAMRGCHISFSATTIPSSAWPHPPPLVFDESVNKAWKPYPRLRFCQHREMSTIVGSSIAAFVSATDGSHEHINAWYNSRFFLGSLACLNSYPDYTTGGTISASLPHN